MLDVLLYVLPEVLRKAKTEAERRSSAALMAAIKTLYFIRQSSPLTRFWLNDRSIQLRQICFPR
jgi:hypothetical protein